MTKIVGGAVVVVIGLALISLLYVMAIISANFHLTDQIGLPLLAISGVVLLISILALAAIAFSLFDLDDKSQALGLPEGSVRAVIALSLVLLFAILAVYLYGSLASATPPMQLSGLAPAQASAALQALPEGGTTLIVGSSGQVFDRASLKTFASSDAAKNSTISVYYSIPHNQAADDFARQLLVMIGTLVTSVASFYFGSKAAGASSAASPMPQGAPVLRKIDPDNAATAGGAKDFVLEGDSLSQVVSVKIVSGNVSIPAQHVVSNQDVIKCNIDIGKATAGNWDVVATDAFGKSNKLAAALKIT